MNEDVCATSENNLIFSKGVTNIIGCQIHISLYYKCLKFYTSSLGVNVKLKITTKTIL